MFNIQKRLFLNHHNCHAEFISAENVILNLFQDLQDPGSSPGLKVRDDTGQAVVEWCT